MLCLEEESKKKQKVLGSRTKTPKKKEKETIMLAYREQWCVILAKMFVVFGALAWGTFAMFVVHNDLSLPDWDVKQCHVHAITTSTFVCKGSHSFYDWHVPCVQTTPAFSVSLMCFDRAKMVSHQLCAQDTCECCLPSEGCRTIFNHDRSECGPIAVEVIPNQTNSYFCDSNSESQTCYMEQRSHLPLMMLCLYAAGSIIILSLVCVWVCVETLICAHACFECYREWCCGMQTTC